MKFKFWTFFGIFWCSIAGIIVLYLFGLDTSFITTLILTLFAILLSVFFYKESSNVYFEIKRYLGDLKSQLGLMRKENQKIIENLNTSDTFNKHGDK